MKALSAQLGRSRKENGDLPVALDTPEPSQNIRRQHGDSCAGSNTRQCPLGSGLAVGKLVSTDDNGDETRNFGNCASKEGLQGCKTGIEGRAALRVRRERDKQGKENESHGVQDSFCRSRSASDLFA